MPAELRKVTWARSTRRWWWPSRTHSASALSRWSAQYPSSLPVTSRCSAPSRAARVICIDAPRLSPLRRSALGLGTLNDGGRYCEADLPRRVEVDHQLRRGVLDERNRRRTLAAHDARREQPRLASAAVVIARHGKDAAGLQLRRLEDEHRNPGPPGRLCDAR